MIKEEDYLKAKQIVQEYEKQLNISDVIDSETELFCVYCLNTGVYKTFGGDAKCPNPKCKAK